MILFVLKAYNYVSSTRHENTVKYTKIIIKNTDVIKINNKEYNTIKVHAKI